MSEKGKIERKMSFTEMLYFEAVFNILSESEVFVERKIRRWAVKELNISYFQTFEMEWPDILQHYYESNLTKLPKNTLISIAKEDYLDDLRLEEEKENAEFAQMIEEEEAEAERLRTLKQTKKKEQSLDQDTNVPEIKEMNLNFDLKE